jgi:hypothetical protein
VRTLYRNNRKKINLPARLGDLDNCRQARQASANHNDSWCCHELVFLSKESEKQLPASSF